MQSTATSSVWACFAFGEGEGETILFVSILSGLLIQNIHENIKTFVKHV